MVLHFWVFLSRAFEITLLSKSKANVIGKYKLRAEANVFLHGDKVPSFWLKN